MAQEDVYEKLCDRHAPFGTLPSPPLAAFPRCFGKALPLRVRTVIASCRDGGGQLDKQVSRGTNEAGISRASCIPPGFSQRREHVVGLRWARTDCKDGIARDSKAEPDQRRLLIQPKDASASRF